MRKRLVSIETPANTIPRPVLDPGDILTPQQLADRLQVKVSWINEQTRQRAKIRNERPLPVIRMGKYLRFSWRAVSEWLLTCQG